MFYGRDDILSGGDMRSNLIGRWLELVFLNEGKIFM